MRGPFGAGRSVSLKSAEFPLVSCLYDSLLHSIVTPDSTRASFFNSCTSTLSHSRCFKYLMLTFWEDVFLIKVTDSKDKIHIVEENQKKI